MTIVSNMNFERCKSRDACTIYRRPTDFRLRCSLIQAVQRSTVPTISLDIWTQKCRVKSFQTSRLLIDINLTATRALSKSRRKCTFFLSLETIIFSDCFACFCGCEDDDDE